MSLNKLKNSLRENSKLNFDEYSSNLILVHSEKLYHDNEKVSVYIEEKGGSLDLRAVKNKNSKSELEEIKPCYEKKNLNEDRVIDELNKLLK